jgi:hypothetical protein
MPINMVSQRDYTLRTLHGHVIFYPAGVPVPTADAAVHEALAANIVPVSERPDLASDERTGVVNAPITIPVSLRDAVILHTIKQLVKENDPATFNAGGQPKLAVLNGLTGIRLSGAELGKYWDRYREILGSNSPFPTHPRVESVMELQRLTTRKQLIEFAEEIGVARSEVERRSIKEAKELLMGATIAYMESAAAIDTAPPAKLDTRTLAED